MSACAGDPSTSSIPAADSGSVQASPGGAASGRAAAAPRPARSRPLRLLTFTTLYPSTERPRHGIFVETRLKHLVATGEIETRVVAPVPWFPLRSRAFGRYAEFARTPRRERRAELPVHHPRYLVVPGIGMSIQPRTLAWTAAREIERIVADGYDFDAIDAHYFFPDGVAAAYLAQRFGRPFVVTARGSDINLIARMPGPGRMILAAARRAAKLIAVSSALKRAMIDLGVAPDSIVVLRNGVDLDLFHPVPRDAARRKLGLGPGGVVASVGNLVREKGHDLVIQALARLDAVTGVIVGDGPDRQRLENLAKALGLAARIRFMSVVPQRELGVVYSAADVLALGSTREGWPNVLLEAMACGTPVVAMDVGGVREIVGSVVAGRVVGRRDSAVFADSLREVLAAAPDRARVRHYAEGFGWEPVSRGQVDVFRSLAGGSAADAVPSKQ
jgi:teichuronic acid biosynthesis glycosyltransferase TuaC